MTMLGVATATLVGITLSVGLAATPAVAAMNPAAAAVTAPVLVGTEPLSQITEDATAAVAEAKEAIAAADALGAEVVASGLDVGATRSVDTSDLEEDIDKLAERDVTPVLVVGVQADEAAAETAKVVSSTETLRGALTAAQEKQAAEEAARVAAEQAAQAAAAQQAAAALAASNTVEGAKASAREQMSSRYGWGDGQFSCLESLWNKESGWNYQAYNPSGATGIPQALPGGKMASAGADWQTSAATQIAWGLGYISSVYGTPCSAWSHSQAMNWY